MSWKAAVGIPIGVYFAVLLFWKEEIMILLGKDGYTPTTTTSFKVALTSIILFIAIVALQYFLHETKVEYNIYVSERQQQARPPKETKTKETATEHYSNTGFKKHSEFLSVREQTNDNSSDQQVEVWAANNIKVDDNKYFRRSGALIYENGDATQFSVAVIHSENSWAKDSERLIQRQMIGRRIKITTAMRQPLISEIVKTNDYILGIGLSSFNNKSNRKYNEKLSYARAWNIAYAVQSLEIKEADRIIGFGLGQALFEPESDTIEKRQRAVVLIGVNASRDVIAIDVLRAAAMIINVPGVSLEKYSHSISNPVRMTQDEAARRLLTIDEVGELVYDDKGWVLPKVPE